MELKKIPRKLKKELKKRVLASHSEAYIKFTKLTLKKIRILYVNKKTGRFGIGTHK